MSIDWVGKLQRLLQTLAFCLTVSALQAIFDDRHAHWIPMVYSISIGTITWALIDFGRHLFPSTAETGWPQGWVGVALPGIGIVTGFLLGMTIGDAISGASTWTPGMRPRLMLSVVISAIAGIAVTYYFYSRQRGAYLERRVIAARRQAAEVRLKLLESQLEPHMLFNTLANLRVLIGIDAVRAQAMLDRLIAFLRATLGASRATQHALQAEFDRLADYLALMQVRMGARLQVSLELTPEVRGAMVPPLLLQPLVENAIKHGLEPKVEGGRIEVKARREGDTLLIEIRDTGIGLGTSAPMPDFAAGAGVGAGAGAGVGAGVGTQLVRERLAALAVAGGVAGDLSLRAADDADGGTLATVRLPYQEEPNAPAPLDGPLAAL